MLDPWSEWLFFRPSWPTSPREGEVALLMGTHRWGWLSLLDRSSNRDFWISGSGFCESQAWPELKHGLPLLIDGVLSEKRQQAQEGIHHLCTGLALASPMDGISLRVRLTTERDSEPAWEGGRRGRAPELVPGLSEQLTLWLRLLVSTRTNSVEVSPLAFVCGPDTHVHRQDPVQGQLRGRVLRLGGERGPYDTSTLLVDPVSAPGKWEWWPIAQCRPAP